MVRRIRRLRRNNVSQASRGGSAGSYFVCWRVEKDCLGMKKARNACRTTKTKKNDFVFFKVIIYVNLLFILIILFLISRSLNAEPPYNMLQANSFRIASALLLRHRKNNNNARVHHATRSLHFFFFNSFFHKNYCAVSHSDTYSSIVSILACSS